MVFIVFRVGVFGFLYGVFSDGLRQIRCVRSFRWGYFYSRLRNSLFLNFRIYEQLLKRSLRRRYLGVLGSWGWVFFGIFRGFRIMGEADSFVRIFLEDSREVYRLFIGQLVGLEWFLVAIGVGSRGNGILVGVSSLSGLVFRLLFWVWQELFSIEQFSLEFLGFFLRLGKRSGMGALLFGRGFCFGFSCFYFFICIGGVRTFSFYVGRLSIRFLELRLRF